ncbi:MAG: LacI family transcriptional regulator [Lachnospiraceae bacterium]|nr:LacI family transcriptional regulator [Lachnospiraceae bacterium]
MKKRATIKDVALTAGISVATVSRVVNNLGVVTPEHEKAVRDAIKQLNYTPNRAARALVKNKTHNIGIIVNNLHDPFFYDLIRGFEDGSIETNYDVMFCSVVNDDPESKEKYVRHLSGGLVDAIILYGSYRTDVHAIECLQNNPNIELAMIENDIPDLSCNKLLVDNIGGAKQAVEYLIANGHRKIAYISGNPNKKVTMDRLNGYVQTMQAHGLEIKDEYIHHVSENILGYQCMKDILKSKEKPTAVFCWDDGVASYAVRACIDEGVSVPGEMSIMGFDNRRIFPQGYRGPDITTIEQPLYQIGKESIELLSKRLSDPNSVEPIRKIYPTRVIEKETVGNIG